MSNQNEPAIDRTAFSVVALDAPSDEVAYWRSQSDEARMAAIELMRQSVYGYGEPAPRLQRVLEVVELEKH